MSLQDIYKFRSIVKVEERDNGLFLTGPFSPVEGAKPLLRHFGIKMHNLIDWRNPQSTCGYGFMAIRHNYFDTKTQKDGVLYAVYVDAGDLIPILMYDTLEPEVIELTPVYKENITPEALKFHRENCEIRYKYDNVIPVLDEEDWLAFCKCLASLDLKPIGYEKWQSKTTR